MTCKTWPTSTHVGHAPLRLRFNDRPWLCGQLKNRSQLTFAQERQKHDLAIRKFERIVMGGCPVLVDLPKDGGLVIDHFVPPT